MMKRPALDPIGEHSSPAPKIALPMRLPMQ